MTQAFNLSQFANKLNTSGQTDNTGLQNSSVTVTAGTGMSGGGAVALGSSVTLTNAGVTSIVAGSGISVSGATGAVTVTNTSSYSGVRAQIFTSSGTFTIPTGITALQITVVGGGGGAESGSSGGTSSVVSGTQTITTISATGGGNSSFAGGNGSGGQLNTKGNTSGPYIGGTAGSGFGNRGTGGGSSGGFQGASGGGYAMSYLTGLTPGATISVSAVGAGGSGGGGAETAGIAGVVVFEW